MNNDESEDTKSSKTNSDVQIGSGKWTIDINLIGRGCNIIGVSGRINVDEIRFQKKPDEYAQALKELSKNINELFKGRQVLEEVKAITIYMHELAREVEEVSLERKPKLTCKTNTNGSKNRFSYSESLKCSTRSS